MKRRLFLLLAITLGWRGRDGTRKKMSRIVLAVTIIALFPIASRIIVQAIFGKHNVGLLAHAGYLALALVAWVVSEWSLFLLAGFATSLWRTHDDVR